MLRIEIDIFSGRPNPVWMITDADAVKEVLGMAGEARQAIAKLGSGYDGVGFREVRVSHLGDEGSSKRGVPASFALGSTAAEDFKTSGELARRLIDLMPTKSDITMVEHAMTPINSEMRDLVGAELERFLEKPSRPRPAPKPTPPSNPLISTISDSKCDQCRYEISQFNPGFWNNAATQPYNNCYNYARNWRTNTFAQPGRAHGAQTGTMACNTVAAAAMADGLKKRCNCLPDSEFPRRLMALVIWPGVDYHWYRHQRGGFWGHKPGGTAARNVDNNNVLITNPETCARGGYVNFCEYFYAGRSVVIN